MNNDSETNCIDIERIKLKQEQLKLEQCIESLKGEKEKAELEKLKLVLERNKVIWNIMSKILIVLITVLIGTVGVAYINNVYQDKKLQREQLIKNKELELQDQKVKAEQRQAEMEYLGQYLEHALENDAERRLRFAEYFSHLTVSEDLQKKWEAYYISIRESVVDLEEKKQAFTMATNEQEKEKLEKEIESLKKRLAPLPQKDSKVTITVNNQKANVGQEIMFTVKVFPQIDFSGFGFDILYNENILSYKEYKKGAIIQNFPLFDVNLLSPGHLRIGGLCFDRKKMENFDSEILSLTFIVIKNGYSDIQIVSLKDDFKNFKTQDGYFKTF